MTETFAPSRPSRLQPSRDSEARARRGGRPAQAWRTASPRARFWISAAALLVLALAVRVFYVLHTQNFVTTTDAKSYDYLAKTLAQGHGWGYGTSAYRPPAYPIFLAGIYLLVGIPHGVYTAARLVEAVVATGTVGLVGLMAGQLAGRKAALIALAIAALYVPLVLVGVSLMSEGLFVLMVVAATNCALRARTSEHRYRWVVLAGIFTGFGALTHGNGIVLGLALAFVVWTGRPRLSWRAAVLPLLLLVVMSITISPWTIRNANAQHAFIPVTDEIGNTLKGTYNDFSAKQRFIWWGWGYHNYDSITHNKKLSESQRNTQLTSAVLRYVGKHPLDVPQAMFWNTLRLLDLQGRRVSRMTYRADMDATAAFSDIGVVAFWIIAALAIVGAFTAAGRRLPRSFWFVPLILWLSVAPVTTGTPRFRAAIDPFVIVVAALGIHALARAVVDRRAPVGPRPARSPSAAF